MWEGYPNALAEALRIGLPVVMSKRLSNLNQFVEHNINGLVVNDNEIFIKTLEMRQGLKIGCPEEIAWRLNYIDDKQFEDIARKYSNSPYGNYLRKIFRETK